MAVNPEDDNDNTKKLLSMPNDITTHEILPRLDVPAVLRFASVCKHWSSLPCDPDFAQRHFEHKLNTQSRVLVFSNRYMGSHCTIFFHSLDAKENWNHPELVFETQIPHGSYSVQPLCHGLVCLSGTWQHFEIYVCNPSTHEVVHIPNLTFDGFQESSRCRVVGFGFDHFTGKYKVMCGFSDTKKCFIHTLGSADGNWKRVGDIPCPIEPKSRSAYLDGSVYWITREGKEILSFSFEDEEYEVLPLPIEKHTKIFSVECMHLKAIGGYLYFVNATTASTPVGCLPTLGFWKLEDYRNRVWTYEFEVTLDESFGSSSPKKLIPVDIQNGNVLISRGSELYVHNLERNVAWEIECRTQSLIKAEFGIVAETQWQANYVESLISVKGNY